MIDVDNTHSSKWSLQGPVDISLSWRALFIKKAKRLKDIKRSPHWQSCFYRGRENSGLRGDTKASSQACVRKQNSSGQSVTPGAFCHSVWWHWTVCPYTYQEEWREVKYCLTSNLFFFSLTGAIICFTDLHTTELIDRWMSELVCEVFATAKSNITWPKMFCTQWLPAVGK